MSKFLKLTNFIINVNDIHTILIKPNKYYINVITKRVDGVNWSFVGFGIGNISSYINEIEVCETKHSIDYKKVTEWIEKN